MAEHTSRAGQRVDRIAVSDRPHEDYRLYDPWQGGYIAERSPDGDITSALPVLSSTAIGNVVDKSVTAYTVTCPDCDIPATYSNKAEPVCPHCGIICTGKDSTRRSRHDLVRDPKAAGRVD
jgi:hypothetical protein